MLMFAIFLSHDIVRAQDYVGPTPSNMPQYFYPETAFSTAPLVPIEIGVKGRQFVTDYLIDKIESIVISVNGSSVVQPYARNVYLADYYRSGKVTRGSLDSINALITSEPIKLKMFSSKSQYSLNIEVNYLTRDGRVAFVGQYQTTTDRLSSFIGVEMYVSMNPTLALSLGEKGTYIQSAKYIFEEPNGASVELATSIITTSEGVMVPVVLIHSYLLGTSGYLTATLENGVVTAINLSTGQKLGGVEATVTLGRYVSSDIVNIGTIKTFTNLDLGNITSAQVSEGKFYGRVPVIDFRTVTGIKENVDFTLPVFNTRGIMESYRIGTQTVWVKKIGGTSGFIEIPAAKGGYDINLPPGEYRLILDFKIKDWSESPNSGKG